MSLFLRVGKNFINKSSIKKMESYEDKNNFIIYKCFGFDDEFLGYAQSYELDFTIDSHFYVPEQNQSYLIEFYLIEGSLEYIYHPIVAWNIEGKFAEPVIAEDMPENHFCIETNTPNGKRWFEPFNCCWFNFQEVKDNYENELKEKQLKN